MYTLECNYNNGKSLNAIKAAQGAGSGRASPPRAATPQHGLSSNKMALITSDHVIMCSLRIKWP